jgi:hypothetical protein
MSEWADTGDALPVSEVRFTAAEPGGAATGLVGYVAFRLGPVAIDGVTLRLTRDGRHVLSFPVRHDHAGAQHPIVRPTGRETRRLIEAEIFRALGIPERAAP